MATLATWRRAASALRALFSDSTSTRRSRPMVEILEGRLAPATVNFAVTQDWGSGFQAGVTVTGGPGAAAVSNWRLEFDYTPTISDIWDATVLSHVGNHYIIGSAGWNSTLAPGGIVSFGFVAGPGNTTAQPSSYLLNGVPLGGTTPAPAPAPSPSPAPAPTPTPTPSGSFQFSVVSDWGSGFTGNVTATNSTGTALNNWSLGFDSAGQISSIWNATITSHVGNHYVVQNAGWNSTIPAGGSVSFGFNGSPGGGAAVPTNFGFVGTNPPPAPTPIPTPTPTPTPPPTASASSWPQQVFAPYVDMTLYPMYNIAGAAQSQGIKYFTLAFIVADASNQPSWGGYQAYEVNGGTFDSQVRSQIASVRVLGGDVKVSFGGAANQELALVITDVNALESAYQKVVDAYSLSHLDFDIEGAAVADHASIDRRSQALAKLEQVEAAAGHPIDVWFTLPVLPTGLTADGLYVLQSALKYGVKLEGVNVMAMDYGDGAAPNPQGQMGTYAIQAASSLFAQLRTLYGSVPTDAQLWHMVGVTPMIGVNDATDEVFDLAAARQLETWAQQQGVGLLSMWSLNRDQQDPAGALNYPTITSSSILQQPYAFSQIFEQVQH
jgi:hypothetical protein